MPVTDMKGLTVKIPADLHAEVKAYIEQRGLTMGEFITLAVDNELHPKIDIKEDKSMERTRTLAFQVDEDLFQRIKDYLHRNNITQKAFVIGLIEEELERDEALAHSESSNEETDEDADEDEDEGIDQESADEHEDESFGEESAEGLDAHSDAHEADPIDEWANEEESLDNEEDENLEISTDEDSQSADTPEEDTNLQEDGGDEDIENEEVDEESESYYPSM